MAFTAQELTAFALAQLVLSSVGFLLDLMVLDKKLPYAFVGSFALTALIVLGYSVLK